MSGTVTIPYTPMNAYDPTTRRTVDLYGFLDENRGSQKSGYLSKVNEDTAAKV